MDAMSPAADRPERGGARFAIRILLAIAVVAAIAPLLAPHDPLAVRTDRILEPPSWEFPAGTDYLGRCVLSRTLHGARWSLGGALAVTITVVVVGTAAGLVAGLGGTLTDIVVMRIVDTVLSFPALLLALASIGILGPGFAQALAAFAAIWWARYARLTRTLLVSLRERDHVLAARSVGAGWRRIAVAHMLPDLAQSLVVVAAIDFGEILLLLSAVSFLGLGITPPTPEWGSMLNDARAYVLTAPRLTFVPGAALASVIVFVNLMSDSARDALDVRSAAKGGWPRHPVPRSR